MSPLVFLCLLFPCLLYGLKRFEAGTPAIGEAIGLGAAIDYLSCIGMEQIHEYEVNMTSILLLLCSIERAIPVIAFSLLLIFAVQKELGTYLYESLLSVPNIQIYGPAPSQTVHRAPLCSFNIENVHPTDIAEILDLQVCRSFNNLVYTLT